MSPDAVDDDFPTLRGIYKGSRRAAGRAKRGLFGTLDAWLHPLRRRHARNRVGALAGPHTVLFVCLGNVCRSPYAAERFRERADESGLRSEVSSAGFIGPDRAPPDLALRQARARGLDTSAHRSRVVTPDLVARATLLVGMEARHLRRLGAGRRTPSIVLGDLDPEPTRRRTIRDPWGSGEEVYESVFSRIDRCVDELVRLLSREPESRRSPATVATPARPSPED